MDLPLQRTPARDTLTVLAPDPPSCVRLCRELDAEGWAVLWATRLGDGQVELVLVKERS